MLNARSANHFSLAADPTDANLVYVGGTFYDVRTYTGGGAGYTGSGVLFRGDRSRPYLAGAVTQALIDADTTFQWTPLTDNKAAYLVGDEQDRPPCPRPTRPSTPGP